jgi:predicted acylesterase/phospholipase RssA
MTTRHRRPTRNRAPAGGIGLALAGGGPLGGIYEVGALLALADSIEGLDLCALDVYVGVSSGGFVAAALANGMSPSQMYRLFIDEGDVDMVKALNLYRRNGFDGVIIPDHTPQMTCGASWHAGMAFALGYVKGVLQTLEHNGFAS